MAVFLLLVLLSILFGLVILSRRHEEEHNHVVNILGRQRMLSQQMAKEASRLAALYEAIASPDRVQPVDLLREKLPQVKSKLEAAAARFEATLNDAREGGFSYEGARIRVFSRDDREAQEIIAGLMAAWEKFNPRVEVVLRSTTNDRSFREALIYINENNEDLLARSEALSAIAFERFASQAEKSERLLSAFIACLAAAVAFMILGLYRLLFEPYALFYQGLKTLGRDIAPPEKTPKRLSPLMREVGDTFALLRDLVSLTGAINQGTSFDDTLSHIFRTFKPYIPYNYIGVATFSGYEGRELLASYGVSDGSVVGLPDRLFGLRVDVATTSLARLLASNEPRVISDLEAYAQARPMRDYTRIILESGVRSSITLPLAVNGKALGFLFFSSVRKSAYTEMHLAFLTNIRDALAISFEKDIFVDDLVYSSTLALAKMAEARDEDTAEHLDRMRQYSTLLARAAKEEGVYADLLDPATIRAIERFSPMHDIGKVGIRDNVLLKLGRLEGEELVHMRSHAIYGANVLREAERNIARSGRSIFARGISIALSHHERWDGKGYPEGLSGERIPLEARIVSIADVLDALTTRRPYKEPFTFERSVDMILEGRGSQFDPRLIGVFSHRIGEFRALYEEFRARGGESYS